MLYQFGQVVNADNGTYSEHPFCFPEAQGHTVVFDLRGLRSITRVLYASEADPHKTPGHQDSPW